LAESFHRRARWEIRSMCRRWLSLAVLVVAAVPLGLYAQSEDEKPPPGFLPLFNGKDLNIWRFPRADKPPWTVRDGMIDCDPRIKVKGDRNLWTKKSHRDFVLRLDWRFKSDPGLSHRVPLLERDGSVRRDARGRDVYIDLDDMQAGVLLRGKEKNVVTITKWPVGSGGIAGPRPDPKAPVATRTERLPKERADNPVGEWNTFEISVKGDRVSVKLNDKDVVTDVPLPEPAKDGPVGLECHGRWDPSRGRWAEPPGLVQFKSVFIRDVK
jgi:Domain of Unknown Function (DUF1080)